MEITNEQKIWALAQTDEVRKATSMMYLAFNEMGLNKTMSFTVKIHDEFFSMEFRKMEPLEKEMD